MVRFLTLERDLNLFPNVHTGTGARPVSYSTERGDCFPVGKAASCEADLSPPTSAEVKNEWIYTSTPPYAFMAGTGTNSSLPCNHNCQRCSELSSNKISKHVMLFHVDQQSAREKDGRMDGRTDMTKLIVPFRSFANAPKTGSQCNTLFHVIYLPAQISFSTSYNIASPTFSWL